MKRKRTPEEIEEYRQRMLRWYAELAREAYGDDMLVVLSEAEPGVYKDNPTIARYKAQGYEFYDANIFGMGSDQMGEVLLFRKPAE